MNRETKITLESQSYIHHGAGSGAENDKVAKLILKNIDEFMAVPSLLVDCGSGIIAGELKRRGATVTTCNSNYINYRYSQKNCEGEHLFGDVIQDGIEGTFDQVLFRITKSAQYNYSTVNRLLRAVKKKGQLFIAGGNKEGIKSVEKRLNQAGIPTTIFATGGGGRILQIAACGESIIEEYETLETVYSLDGESLAVQTIPGLFSYGKCDKGSQLLLDTLPGITGKKVLDLGCGSGILTLAAFKKGAASVVATDIHATALAATKMNVPTELCTVLPSYIGDELDEKFDVIVTNPPFHEGQKSNFSIGEEWLRKIRNVADKRTVVYLVANNFLPYIRMGEAVFEKVERLAEANGFSVYKMSGVTYE